jgi:hypothetical protein
LQHPHFIGSSVSCAACDACVAHAFALLFTSFCSSSDSQSQVLVEVDWFQQLVDIFDVHRPVFGWYGHVCRHPSHWHGLVLLETLSSPSREATADDCAADAGLFLFPSSPETHFKTTFLIHISHRLSST